jgi:ankyrin repeat protein
MSAAPAQVLTEELHDKRTALMLAVTGGYSRLAQRLIHAGAELDVTDKVQLVLRAPPPPPL